MSKRLGLSSTVAQQIERYREAAEHNASVPADEAISVFRLVGRRPDATLVYSDAGRRAARYAARSAGMGTKVLLGVSPGPAPRRFGVRVRRAGRQEAAGPPARPAAPEGHQVRLDGIAGHRGRGFRARLLLLQRRDRRAAPGGDRLRGRDGPRALPRPGRRPLFLARRRGGRLRMIRRLTPPTIRPHCATGLTACGADGWLLFDFQGHNPVASRMLALGGLGSRRIFVLLPPGAGAGRGGAQDRAPAAGGFPRPGHSLRQVGGAARRAQRAGAREDGRDGDLPAGRRALSGPGSLRGGRADPVAGRQGGVERAAGDPVRGDVERRRSCAATSRRRRRWRGSPGRRWRSRSRRGGSGSPKPSCSSGSSRRWSGKARTRSSADRRFRSQRGGSALRADAGKDRALAKDEVVLIDLFGRYPGAISADQTWMGFSGRHPPERVPPGLGRGTGRDGMRRSSWCGGPATEGEALPGLPGGPRRAGRDREGGVRGVLRAPDRALDRPRPARLRAPHGRLRNQGRPDHPVRDAASRSSRGSTCRMSSGCGAK